MVSRDRFKGLNMNSRLKSSGVAALSFSVSAGLLALALTPSVAAAATTGEVEATITGSRELRTREVSVAGLDLTKASDLKRLHAKVRSAIVDVCADGGNVRITFAESQCRRVAKVSTDRQIADLRSAATARMAAGQAPASSKIAVVAAR